MRRRRVITPRLIAWRSWSSWTLVLAAERPGRVLDAGCNTGTFALLAAGAGADVVAIDADVQAVERLARHSAQAGPWAARRVLPLCVDFAQPTPATGWENRESRSFLERMDGAFDLVMMLAVVHHLLLTDQIPLREIASLCCRLTRKALLIEWVPVHDPRFRELVRGRDALYAALTEEAFRGAMAERFHFHDERRLSNGRILFHLRRKELTLATSAGRSRWARAYVRGLGLAFGVTVLCLLLLINPLISFSHVMVYHFDGPPADLFLPVLIDITLVWSIVAGLLTIGAGRLRASIRVGILLMLPWIALKELSILADEGKHGLRHHYSFPLACLPLLGVVAINLLWSRRRTQTERLLERGEGVLFWLSITGAIMVAQLLFCFVAALGLNRAATATSGERQCGAENRSAEAGDSCCCSTSSPMCRPMASVRRA